MEGRDEALPCGLADGAEREGRPAPDIRILILERLHQRRDRRGVADIAESDRGHPPDVGVVALQALRERPDGRGTQSTERLHRLPADAALLILEEGCERSDGGGIAGIAQAPGRLVARIGVPAREPGDEPPDVPVARGSAGFLLADTEVQAVGTPARELEEVAEQVCGGDETPGTRERIGTDGPGEEIFDGDMDRREQESDGGRLPPVPERGKGDHRVEEVRVDGSGAEGEVGKK